MESTNDSIAVPIACGESIVGQIYVAGALEKEVDALHSNLVNKSNSGLNTGPPCGGIKRPRMNGATTSLPGQSSSISPFIESMVLPNIKRMDQSHSGLVFPKHKLSSDGVICHNLKPCQTQSDMFEVQLSETCQRRFVMFDHSGSKKRIIFHPSMVDEVPILQFQRNFPDLLPDVNTRAVGCMNETLVSSPLSADYAEFYARLVPQWSSVRLTGRGEDSLLAFHTAGTETTIQGNDERNLDCLSRENTEDLEALLWSDDEMSSTGHSPSDLTSSDAHMHSACCSLDYGTCSGRKRKVFIGADADSTTTSGFAKSERVECNYSDIEGRGSGYGKDNFTVFDLSFANEVSSSGSTNNQRSYKIQTLGRGRSMQKTRKEKIQSTLHLLRAIIPGGQLMDTALVLDEAIQYVKTLQVEVQKLEAKKFT